MKRIRLPRRPHLPQRQPKPAREPRPLAAGVLGRSRTLALVVIAALVAAASLVSFAESYRALYDWATRHELSGLWADVWPIQVDVFIAVGELALFIALADAWNRRSRIGAWLVTLTGLAVSVAGNVGHTGSHVLAVRVTAAVPPIAAAAALAIGLGVLKRVVEHRPANTERVRDFAGVASDVVEAAKASMRATAAAGNPWSVDGLRKQFPLTRAQATKVRQAVLAESNGHPTE